MFVNFTEVYTTEDGQKVQQHFWKPAEMLTEEETLSALQQFKQQGIDVFMSGIALRNYYNDQHPDHQLKFAFPCEQEYNNDV